MSDLPKPTLIPFDDVVPAVPGESQWPEIPRWLSWLIIGTVVLLYIGLFPITVPLTIWKWKSIKAFMEGGQALSPEDMEEVDWGAVHRGETDPPEKLKLP